MYRLKAGSRRIRYRDMQMAELKSYIMSLLQKQKNF